MTRIVVRTGDGEHVIHAIGYDDPPRAIEAHGFDPDDDDWSIQDPNTDLVDTIENADTLDELKAALLSEYAEY